MRVGEQGAQGAKMKQVVLHVGLPKAGSTYLQKAVFPNIDDVFFLGRDDGLISRYLDYISWKNPFTLDLRRARKEIEASLAERSENHALFSREAFFGNFYTTFVCNRTTAEALKTAFPDAKVVIVLRRQDRITESAYKQALHQGHSVGLRKFLGYRDGCFDLQRIPLQDASATFDVTQLNWYRLVRNYYDLFGRDNVLVLPQELLRKDQMAFLEQFYDFTGLKPYFPSAADVPPINRGYSFLSAQIARGLNRFLVRPWNGCGFIPEKPFLNYFQAREHDGKLWRALGRASRAMQLRAFLQQGLDRLVYIDRPLISPSVASRIMELHYEDNARLEKEYGIDLGRWGYCG